MLQFIIKTGIIFKKKKRINKKKKKAEYYANMSSRTQTTRLYQTVQGRKWTKHRSTQSMWSNAVGKRINRPAPATALWVISTPSLSQPPFQIPAFFHFLQRCESFLTPLSLLCQLPSEDWTTFTHL